MPFGFIVCSPSSIRSIRSPHDDSLTLARDRPSEALHSRTNDVGKRLSSLSPLAGYTVRLYPAASPLLRNAGRGRDVRRAQRTTLCIVCTLSLSWSSSLSLCSPRNGRAAHCPLLLPARPLPSFRVCYFSPFSTSAPCTARCNRPAIYGRRRRRWASRFDVLKNRK